MDKAARGAAHNDDRRLLYLITDPLSTRLLRGQLRWMTGAGFDVHLA